MPDSSQDLPPDTPDRYEVGYGKPPRHSRFKEGRSGNPKGRPPRSRNMATILAKALSERVAVTENGRRRTVTKLEVIVAQLVNKSAAADPRSMTMLIGLLQELDAAGTTRPREPDVFADADERVLKGLRKRMEAAGVAGEPERS